MNTKSVEEVVEEFFRYEFIPAQVEMENPRYWKGYKDTCDIIREKLRTTLTTRDEQMKAEGAREERRKILDLLQNMEASQINHPREYCYAVNDTLDIAIHKIKALNNPT